MSSGSEFDKEVLTHYTHIMKTCAKCGESKPLSEFSTNGDRVNSHCKTCRSAAYRARYDEKEKERLGAKRIADRERAARHVRALKNNPCVDCGQTYPFYNMQFDHLGDKEYTVGRLVGAGASNSKIDREIAKCELVCVLCHGDRTYDRRVDNGTALVLS